MTLALYIAKSAMNGAYPDGLKAVLPIWDPFVQQRIFLRLASNIFLPKSVSFAVKLKKTTACQMDVLKHKRP